MLANRRASIIQHALHLATPAPTNTLCWCVSSIRQRHLKRSDATRKITESTLVGCFLPQVRVACQERHGQHGGFVRASMLLAGPWRVPMASPFVSILHLNNALSLSDMGLLSSRTTVTRTTPCTSWTGRSCAESGWSSNMPVGRAGTGTSTVGVTGVAAAVSAVFYRIFPLSSRVKGRRGPTWPPSRSLNICCVGTLLAETLVEPVFLCPGM